MVPRVKVAIKPVIVRLLIFPPFSLFNLRSLFVRVGVVWYFFCTERSASTGPETRFMTLPGTLLLALLVASPVAVAEIYKCKDSKGNEKYQNFPCQIDSIGSKATAAPPKEDPAASAARPVATASAAVRPNPVPGMRMVEVRDVWGTPKKTKVNRGVESWFYAGPDGN